ncbi:MAG: tail fiber domain-containing protein, partial [Phycisphaerae bacterium]|nr:tail fiber domain-containing protein [Saprospiraceae bacterium]
GNTSITSIKGQVGFTTFSDARIKTNIQENVPGLPFIQKLRPVTYHYDIHRQNALMGIVDTAMWEGKYDIEKMTFSGFLAQEVEQAAQSLGYEFSGVDAPKNDQGLYGLRYAEFVVPMVKAMQEQQTQIERLQQENQALKAQMQQQNTDMLATLKALQAEMAQVKTSVSEVQLSVNR